MGEQGKLVNPGEELTAFARETLGLSVSAPMELSPLGGRGSDRAFFRVTWGHEDSAILIHYNPQRIENACYGEIGLFLRDIHVPVPRLLGHDRVRCLMMMEDLGDRDLWAFRSAPWEMRRTLYEKSLTIVHRLHAFPEKEFPFDRVRLMDAFGPDLYLWERNYFRDHFVQEVCGIELDPRESQGLETELSALGARLSRGIHSLVHRDLQSQNVMIRNGEPFLIDFQGMRFGSPFYDLGSLLYDPYVAFTDLERDELVAFCFGLSTWGCDWVSFRSCFHEASAQRLMQALGAYGFLGLSKGLTSFLGHIPAGLGNLLHAASRTPSLPRLAQLTERCRQVFEEKDISPSA